jgi:hypothetical protein
MALLWLPTDIILFIRDYYSLYKVLVWVKELMQGVSGGHAVKIGDKRQ